MAAAAPLIPAMVAIGSAVAGVVGSVVSSQSSKKTAEENLDFQKEQFQYEKDLQSTIMDREDNAIQRQVADSRAAGISPILNMSGSQSSGAAGIAVNAPQREQTPDTVGSLFTAISGLSSVMQTINQTKKDEAEIDSMKLDNEFKLGTMDSRIRNMSFLPMLAQSRLQSDALSRKGLEYQLKNILPLTRDMQQAQYDDFMREYNYRKDNGIYASTPSNSYELGGALFNMLREFKPSSPIQPDPVDDAIRTKGKEAQEKALDASNDIVDELVKMIEESTEDDPKKKKRNDRAKNLYQNSARLRQDAVRAGQL